MIKKLYFLTILFLFLASCYRPSNPISIILPEPYKTSIGSYQIYTKENLLWVLSNATSPLGYITNDIMLKKDIDMDGTQIKPIAGLDTGSVFDGGGNTIKNFKIDKTENIANGVAAFIMTNNGIVRNLGIENANVRLDNTSISSINVTSSSIVAKITV